MKNDLILVGYSNTKSSKAVTMRDGNLPLSLRQSADDQGKQSISHQRLINELKFVENHEHARMYLCCAKKPYRELEIRLYLLIKRFPLNFFRIFIEFKTLTDQLLNLPKQLRSILCETVRSETGKHRLLFCDARICRITYAFQQSEYEKILALSKWDGVITILSVTKSKFCILAQTNSIEEAVSILRNSNSDLNCAMLVDQDSLNEKEFSEIANLNLSSKRIKTILKCSDEELAVGAVCAAYYFYFNKSKSVIFQDVPIESKNKNCSDKLLAKRMPMSTDLLSSTRQIVLACSLLVVMILLKLFFFKRKKEGISALDFAGGELHANSFNDPL